MKKLPVLLLAALLCLSACFGGDDEPDVVIVGEEDSETVSVEDESGTMAPEGEDAPAPASPEEGATGPASSTPVRSLQSAGALTQGSYAAISTTAMGITGDIHFDSDLINFGKGQTVTTRLIEMAPATQAYNETGSSWASLLFVPEAATIEIREVIGMTTNEEAQPLCGEAPEWVGVGSDRGLKDSTVSVTIALLTGDTPPGPDAPENNVCATYSFSE
ncbi:hypothetical protein [Aquisalinus flavus]|uniref:Uncharacterized protein n=1 Tax=Aquisalinus flavus TaxID=1526572 RepID=A0A8J2V4X6_9PROT|nr:hypothetical protein [Aquisalinus flavus]MBD0427957.1 hypothetical protein [Aquisalinus flavus]UNE47712.1 hypothetical protein FF099_06430 [Aquisalinus flavus]GGD05267.1 hypothetical protein GCM10011342_12750 [Aquisalinus flavus]